MKNKFLPSVGFEPTTYWGKILSKYFILASVLFVLYRDGLAVRRSPRMQEVVGSNPTETEGKICFSHFTLLEWNVKNCFVTFVKLITMSVRWENKLGGPNKKWKTKIFLNFDETLVNAKIISNTKVLSKHYWNFFWKIYIKIWKFQK